MRAEAGKMPGSLIFPIRNGHGVSNDRFGLNGARWFFRRVSGILQVEEGAWRAM